MTAAHRCPPLPAGRGGGYIRLSWRQDERVGDDPLGALRRLCLSLPEVTERPSHGEPAEFVRGKKTFVTYADHHHDDRLAFWCARRPARRRRWSGPLPSASSFRPMSGTAAGWGSTSTCRRLGGGGRGRP